MDLASDIVFYRTYSAVKEDGTKETWSEVCDRYQNHLIHYYPEQEQVIKDCVEYLRQKKIAVSMRLLQFAGKAAQKEQLRGYNCSFVAITQVKDFSDILYLSSCGVGCGFSVQKHHIDQLPDVPNVGTPYTRVIGDSREQWADSISCLMETPDVVFDYSEIRPAGALLSTGGQASGPEPLRECHERIRAILHSATGRKLKPIEVHSICCSIGHAIVAGGVRRSAMISLFDKDDVEMLAAKSGNWWEINPHFARANNSAVMLRSDTTQDEFGQVFDACIASQAGEPGIFFTNSKELGTNPCAEISLKSRQLCNLTEVVLNNCVDAEDFRKAVIAATVLGTFQAGFTTFGYVHKDWSKNCAEDALLGVSITGQANKWELLKTDLDDIARFTKAVNAKIAADIGINRASRIGTVKPSGSTSTLMNCSSGIHADHAPFYIRRIRIGKLDPLAQYLVQQLPGEFVEYSAYEPNDIIVVIPTKRDGLTRKDETAIELLERMKYIKQNWIHLSHHKGLNEHNVSITVNYKDGEIDSIKKWMWDNRFEYNGISLLPYSDATYLYAPFEDISEEKYNELIVKLPSIDLSNVVYSTLNDGRDSTSACEGTLCEWKPK